MGTPTASGAPSSDNMGRIGSGSFGNKPLPLDEASGTAGRIIDAAKGFLGTPYVWGGTSQQGIDCSGLVQAAYAAAGIDLPRVSYQQAAAGQRIALKNLQPGDIVAWDNSSRNNGADHVAIYLGNGRIIEAARPGTNVRISTITDAGEAYGVRLLGSKHNG
jgi:cell wall-associated NlpC family hydrolase